MFRITLFNIKEFEQGTFSTTFTCALIIILDVIQALALKLPTAGRSNPEWISRRFCDKRYCGLWRATKRISLNACGRDTIPTTICFAITIIFVVIQVPARHSTTGVDCWWRATKKRFNTIIIVTIIVTGTDNACGRDTNPTTIRYAIPILLDVIHVLARHFTTGAVCWSSRT